MAEIKLEGGEFLFNEGDIADVAYVVVSGQIELLAESQGRVIQTGIVEPGHAFGELALFDSQALRLGSARAVEGAVINSVSKEEFNGWLAECPRMLQPFLLIAFEKIKSSRVKHKIVTESVLESDITRLRLIPDSEKMQMLADPIDIPVIRLPFRIGGYPEGEEIRRRDQLHLNIPSQNNPLQVSRQHCEIVIENKTLMLTDLGSRFCTTVNDTIIGRGHGSYSIHLKKGENTLILGMAGSPYRFRLYCE